MPDKVKLTRACPRCNGGGEVLANTVRWEQRCEGAFAVCPDCKGSGRLALESHHEG